MKKPIVTLLITGFLVGPILLTGCNSKKAEQQEQKEDEEDEHEEGSDHGQEQVYACPMHPEVTGKEGDKCSKCGMKLELVKNTDSTKVHSH